MEKNVSVNNWPMDELKGCVTPNEVSSLIGEPTESTDTTLSANSAWGLQDSLRHQIPAGGQVKQWVYHGHDDDLCVWFANIDTSWAVTLILCVPAGVARAVKRD